MSNYTNTSHGLSAGIKALIVIVVLAVVAMLAFAMYKKRRNGIAKRNDSAFKDSSASLHLEPDGGVLNEVVQEHAIMAEENGSSHQHPQEHMNGDDHAVQLI